MIALKTHQIDGFVARPDPARPIVLIYGPDAGRVRECAEALVGKWVDDVRDPFALARLDGDDLAGEPSRLVEEANTIPLFGGKRAVWVRAGGKNFAAAVEALIAAPSPDCRVVIEAGELRKNSPLRVACEKARAVAVLPCYADDAEAIERLIDSEIRAAGLAIAPDALEALVPLLGGDRLASRGEIRKLALYARGKARIERDDVMAVIADASGLMLDDVVDAAFAGRTGEVESEYAKARVAGTSPGSIMSAALRQVSTLHRARLDVDAGRPLDEAIAGVRPPLHFKRKDAARAALKAWTAPRLERAMILLAAALFEVRRQPDLGEAIAQRALLSLAVNARRKES